MVVKLITIFDNLFNACTRAHDFVRHHMIMGGSWFDIHFRRAADRITSATMRREPATDQFHRTSGNGFRRLCGFTPHDQYRLAHDGASSLNTAGIGQNGFRRA